ncbi:MAG: hypothetical protein QN178_03470 [Armatimonadota bacterium]|nr:hypothetical protein [Armatimonadota bacterium]
MAATRTAGDATGRWLGLGVFVLGVIFLVLVFSMAYRDVVSAGVLGRLMEQQAAQRAPDWWALAVKGVMFVIMMISGALVANRGIGLYAAARGGDEG